MMMADLRVVDPNLKDGEQQKKPKVLILCQLFYPELISSGQTLTELGEELVKQGVDVEVVCAPTTVIDTTAKVDSKIVHQGIRINRVWSTRFPKLNFWGRICNILTFSISTVLWLFLYRDKRPILVTTSPSFIAFFCGLLKPFGGRPYIFLVFDVHPDAAIDLKVLKKGSLVAKLWDFFNKITFKNAEAIVTIGRCMEKLILAERKAGERAKDKMKLIHVWSDDKQIQKGTREKNRFIERWGLEGKTVFGYSGNFGRFHEVETMMQAALELKDNKDILFLFVGEGYKKKWLEQFAKNHKLDNCQFHTYVEREELSELLASMDVGFVSLSKGQEGLSVPSKTYGVMAASLPVIATMGKEAEIAMIIDEHKCGFVIESGDVDNMLKSILTLHEDKALRKEMGANASRAVKTKYNLSEAAKKYKELITSLQYSR